MPEPLPDGATAGSEPQLVGREREQRLLDALVAAAPGGGAAAVVLGEPGSGKTSLLRHAMASSTARVLWVRGEESETHLPFAAASDLLTPFRSHLGALPAAQRRALEVALALTDAAVDITDDRPPLAACSGALGLLAAAADTGPLLALIDDMQWIDLQSRQVIGFVARRLSGEHLVMLLAVQDVPGAYQPVRGLPTLRLAGLSPAECELLARSRGYDVPPEVMAEIVAATGGNPRAVLETLARGWTRGGTGEVAVGTPSRRAWRWVLARLPEPTQRALFVLAAGPLPGAALESTLHRLGLSLADLEPAEQRDLVVVDDFVRLRHPLLRQVLLDATPIAVRRDTYRTLADLARPEQPWWYLSLATAGADERVAGQLADGAGSLRAHGDRVAAMRLARRAAELTGDPSVRAGRLLSAAADAHAAGDCGDAVQWCRAALALDDEPPLVTDATLTLGRALISAGHPDQAHDALVGAARRLQAEHAEGAAALLAEAAVAAAAAGDGERATAAATGCEHLLAGEVTPTAQMLAGTACGHLLADDVATARAQLESAGRLGSVTGPPDGWLLSGLAEAWLRLEEHDRARTLLNLAVDDARREGVVAVLAAALAVRAELEVATGQWAPAQSDAAEGLEHAARLRQFAVLGSCALMLARVEAGRGRREASERHVLRARQETCGLGLVELEARAQAVTGLAALTCGDPESAMGHLDRARQLAGGATWLGRSPWLPDLIEARVRCGDRCGAAELLPLLQRHADTTGLSHPAAAAARCRGLLVTDVDEAAAAFTTARERHARCPMPFELGRTLLCEGEVLRRGRHRSAAQRVLRDAAAIFDTLGAPAWLARARAELSAAGGRAPAAPSATQCIDSLTPQELQIARLVAAGSNNIETAAALFVSRKTVEAHLTRVYRKLQVRSRSELARVLSVRGGPEPR